MRIDKYGQEIAASAYMNAIRWKVYDNEACMDKHAFSERYNRELSQIKIFLQKRLQYLDDIWTMESLYN